MSRGGGWGRAIRGLVSGQSENTQVNKHTQVDIPNWSGWWSLVWAFGRWVFLFAVVFPFGLQALWGVFDSCRDWPIVYRLNLYSFWWTMPTWGGVVAAWWRLIFLAWGWEGWRISGSVIQRHVTEIKWPFWSGQPMQRIHNWEIARPGKEPPHRYEDVDYADHDVPEQKPPGREITINIKKGRKSNKVILPGDWETEAFLIGVLNGAKSLSQTESGWGRGRWLKLRKILLGAKFAKWKNFFHHKQGLELTDLGKQSIEETFPQRGK